MLAGGMLRISDTERRGADRFISFLAIDPQTIYTGSIVVISSMSSQIYNQSALNEPLRHVSFARLRKELVDTRERLELMNPGLNVDVVVVIIGLLQLVQGGRLELGQELGR